MDTVLGAANRLGMFKAQARSIAAGAPDQSPQSTTDQLSVIAAEREPEIDMENVTGHATGNLFSFCLISTRISFNLPKYEGPPQDHLVGSTLEMREGVRATVYHKG